MKHTIFSLAEKKLLRTVIVLVLIQLLIIFTFVFMFRNSQQINVNDTKQIDITVNDVYYFRVLRENWLFVVSDSTEYLFTSRSTIKEYSVSKLYESIHEGDELFLMYKETYTVLGKVNLVVDARSKTETYRTIEDYNDGKQGIPVFLVVVFSIIEIVFIGIVFVYAWINYIIFKGVFRKIKQLLKQKGA